jgi:hypothetical protein
MHFKGAAAQRRDRVELCCASASFRAYRRKTLPLRTQRGAATVKRTFSMFDTLCLLCTMPD